MRVCFKGCLGLGEAVLEDYQACYNSFITYLDSRFCLKGFVGSLDSFMEFLDLFKDGFLERVSVGLLPARQPTN